MDYVILVDSQDNELGVMEKLEAHEKGILHRAFSIFLFNSKGEMLIQQRALSKYHSPGLWTNACCSHPAPAETILEAGKRRLQEELGLFTVLVDAFKFEYRDPKDFCIKTACYLSRHSVHLFQAHYVQLLLHFMLSCYLNYSDVCLDEVEFQLRNQLKLFFFFCPMSMYV